MGPEADAAQAVETDIESTETDTNSDEEYTPPEHKRRKPQEYERQRYKGATNPDADDDSDDDEKDDDLSDDDVRKILNRPKGTDDDEGDDDETEENDEGKGQKTGKKEGTQETKAKKGEGGHKVKVSVDGREGVVDLDSYLPGLGKLYEQAPDDKKEQFLRNVQKSIAADKRFEDFAKLKKQAVSIIQALKSENPFALFRHEALKMDPEKYRAALEKELYDNFVAPEQMDPKDRKIWELQRNLKKNSETLSKIQEAEREKEIKDTQKYFREDVTKQITSAIDENQLPRSAFVVGLFAKYMRQALRHKGQDGNPIRLKASQVADIVKEDLQRMYRDMFSSADGDRLIQVFGEEIAEKINKARMQKLKKEGKPSVTGDSPPPKRSRKGPKSFAEWRQRNRVRE